MPRKQRRRYKSQRSVSGGTSGSTSPPKTQYVKVKTTTQSDEKSMSFQLEDKENVKPINTESKESSTAESPSIEKKDPSDSIDKSVIIVDDHESVPLQVDDAFIMAAEDNTENTDEPAVDDEEERVEASVSPDKEDQKACDQVAEDEDLVQIANDISADEQPSIVSAASPKLATDIIETKTTVVASTKLDMPDEEEEEEECIRRADDFLFLESVPKVTSDLLDTGLDIVDDEPAVNDQQEEKELPITDIVIADQQQQQLSTDEEVCPATIEVSAELNDDSDMKSVLLVEPVTTKEKQQHGRLGFPTGEPLIIPEERQLDGRDVSPMSRSLLSLSDDTQSDNNNESNVRAQQIVSGLQDAMDMQLPYVFSDQAKYLNDLHQINTYLGLNVALPGDSRIKVPLEEDKRFAGLKIEQRMQYAFKHACLIYDPKLLIQIGLLRTENVSRLRSWLIASVPIMRIVTELAFPGSIHHSHQGILLDRTLSSGESTLSDAVRKFALVNTRVKQLRDQLGGFDGVALSDMMPDQLPIYYLCIDRTKEAIVLSVRGKKPEFDLEMVKVNSDESSYAAKAMWRSAFWVTVDVLGPIQKALEKSSRLRLVVTGHSIGAGIAAIVSYMIAQLLPQFRHLIDGFAFASPPVMSMDLAESCMDIVQSIVIGNDMITRMTKPSLNVLSERIQKLADKDQNEPRFYSKMKSFLTNYDRYTNDEQLRSKYDDFFEEVVGIDKPMKSDLYLAGQMLWYVPQMIVDGLSDVNEVRRVVLCTPESLIDFKGLRFEQYFSNYNSSDQIAHGLANLGQSMSVSGLGKSEYPSIFKKQFVFVDASQLRGDWNNGLSLDLSLSSVLTHLPNSFAPAMKLDRLDESIDSEKESWLSHAASSLSEYLFGGYSTS